jgi:plasmid stabilization system protein ParE
MTSTAHRDLVSHGQYLVARNAAIARRFLAAVRLSCERIQLAPDLGERWTDGETQSEIFHCWCVRGFENYVIFYRVLPDAIEISRVLHSAQDLDRELGKSQPNVR